MSMTLSDLYRLVRGETRSPHAASVRHEPATIGDLIDALRAEGYVVLTSAELDALMGEVGLRLLRYERTGGTLTPERVQTTMLNVFDTLASREEE